MTATANVLLTAVPGPGIDFDTDGQQNIPLPVVDSWSGSEQASKTFRSSSNVTVKRNTRGAPAKMLPSKQGEVYTFTIKEQKNASRIATDFTGSSDRPADFLAPIVVKLFPFHFALQSKIQSSGQDL